MKKISKILIQNFKAYIEKEEINLPNGENILIYGENGSGKSSLFYALYSFFKSSVDKDTPFDRNYFSTEELGKIELTFDNYDKDSKKLIPNTSKTFTYDYTLRNSTNNDTSIKLGYRLSGFLDYSRLLKVYLNKGDKPNLYPLVIDILKDYIPTTYGLKNSIDNLIKTINEEIHQSYHRNDNKYRTGKQKFIDLQQSFPNIIHELNSKLNYLLENYFTNSRLKINFSEPDIKLMEDCKIKDTAINGELYLEVNHFDTPINAYNTHLNEAKLSAIAICLYLASIKLKEQDTGIKLLYLDDIFVGLDSANRRPILNIITKEFSTYQIILSTYDKSWYTLANEVLKDSGCWIFIEMYESEYKIKENKQISKPLLLYSSSLIERARRHLFNKEQPDYPAAANYFRKSFEELLSKKFFKPSMLNQDLENIETYKIPKLIEAAQRFLNSIPLSSHSPQVSNLLKDLSTYLKPLLHPLSHFVLENPIYRSELIKVNNLYDKLNQLLNIENYNKNCNLILGKNETLMLKINSSADWRLEVLLKMDDNLLTYFDDKNILRLSKSSLHTIKQTLIIPHKRDEEFSPNSKMKIFSNFCYEDLKDCLNKYKTYVNSKNSKYNNACFSKNSLDMFFLMDNTTNESEPTYNEALSIKFKSLSYNLI